ncbi:DUF2804 domain-containing protein [Nocardioides sp. Y6]|uniref:DUF2804 domain-containing protein n=1 Tax=Nocardioides malaquae TaxID=2773426 RepID=A0ABR9RW68_9ACTN|nr:DUF2804 domain-containing protein [Nocardioides malaquae]MBE7325828.1 DUF2804 domain-containing protein [Nocardioides malaquae]
MTEREITEPVDLCLPDGRLNPAAVGWTRTPLHRANLKGWGRAKRWEYWGIVTPTHVVGVVLSSLDYAGVPSLYVLERATGREWAEDGLVPLGRGVVLPEVSGRGLARTSGGGVRITLDQRPDSTSIAAQAGAVEIHLDVPLPPGHESLGVVVPWSETRFQYTVKDVARPVSGTLTIEGVTHEVGEGSFAVLDHGRGKWPYSMTWNWGAGYDPARRVGLQVGGQWTDGTGSTENALFVDGRLHKISDVLEWSYDRADWLKPWHVGGPRVDATFTPFHERVATTNLVVLAGETHQCFGHFSGWATTDDGERVSLDGLVGWVEEARNRW